MTCREIFDLTAKVCFIMWYIIRIARRLVVQSPPPCFSLRKLVFVVAGDKISRGYVSNARSRTTSEGENQNDRSAVEAKKQNYRIVGVI